jgi:ubiquitin-like protein Pup
MSDGGQIRGQRSAEETDEVIDEEHVAEEVDTSDVDELLDEIDEVLEENAEEFVRNYVQKGGQ